jgi:hypothetical protein
MTLFGKILVMFNLACALFLAAWAFSIYATGVDWAANKSKGAPSVPIGQYAIRADKITELWKGLEPAQTDWQIGRARLAKEEMHLAADRIWYDKEIRHVLHGPAKNKPLTEVVLADKDDEKSGVRKGQVLLDDQEHPKMAPSPLQLQSLDEYNKEDEGILASLATVMAEHVAQIGVDIELTDKIIGDKAKGIRGFQQRIFDEQAKSAALLAELSLIEPQLINTMVEAQTIAKRHDQMVKRIEELKRLKVASGR